MSRSSNIVESPCVKYLKWSSDNGEFKYWDKEEEKDVSVPLPFRFLVLDQLTTIKGFSESDNIGIWSNEVRNHLTDTLLVKTFSGRVIAEGKYKSIKAKVQSEGGKFCNSIYIVVDGEIWNISLKGAGYTGWLNLTKRVKSKVYKEAVICTGFKSEKKGKVTFSVPVFEISPATEEENENAKELDSILQEYLVYYLNRPKSEESAPPLVTEGISEEDY